MHSVLETVAGDTAARTRSRIFGIYGILLALNILAWLWAVVAFRHYPVLLGTAFLAYSFGLRHAFDADHIAAIDNVTRKMMQEGRRPVAVGLYFSLGHSTVVVALSLSLLGRGTLDVPLHALAATAAALWIVVAMSDERAVWQTILATRGDRPRGSTGPGRR